MCQKVSCVAYDQVPLDWSGGQEESWRARRLMYVLGFIEAKTGSLSFLESLQDHKGMLTGVVYSTKYKDSFKTAIQESWEAVYESEFEIIVVNPCSECRFCPE